MAKILIVYFSRRGENYVKGKVQYLPKGNTALAAEMVQKAVGGTLFELETVKCYGAEYRACVQEAVAELKANARPDLKAVPAQMEDYDVVFLGYPSWCGTMPMAVWTFLEQVDWKGKKLCPFCSNEGSGMGRSESDLKKLCPGVELAAGLSIRGCETAESEAEIAAWAESCREQAAK